MGWLSWLFPTPADRIAKARKLLDKGQPAEARLEVLGLEQSDAVALVTEAEQALCTLNLEAAVSWAQAGDELRVETHLELAQNFDPGTLGERFREVRREIREITAAKRAEEQAKQAKRDAWQTSIDPMGVTGRSDWLEPDSIEEGGLPAAAHDPAEAEMRVALAVEAYPEDLRADIDSLGKPFLQAVLHLDDGRPDQALQSLLGLPDDQPLVLWERARAAYALGDPTSTARTLRQLGALRGHRVFGNQHSGEFLARVTAETGDLAGALATIREVRRTAPGVGGPLLGSLLLHDGALEEAESVLREEIKAHPRSYMLYDLLAEARLRGGHRKAAIECLERSMDQNCTTPGKCGYNPPPPQLLRKLATLYLEDGTKPARVDELVSQAAPQRSPSPGWEELYLDALLARRDGDSSYSQLAQVLWQHTPDHHPGRVRLEQHLPRPSAA